MNYIAIKGFRGGNLFYIREKKRLFLRKSTKLGQTYLVCYDTVLTKNYKKKNPSFEACPSRCVLNESTGLLRYTESSHREHDDHECIFNDLVSLNAMKDRCRYLAVNYPYSARRIPVKEIYLAEMSK